MSIRPTSSLLASCSLIVAFLVSTTVGASTALAQTAPAPAPAATKKLEAKAIEKIAEQTQEELAKKEQELSKAEAVKQKELIKKEAVEKTVELKEKAAEVKKAELEAVQKKAKATRSPSAKKEAARLAGEVTRLENEAETLKQELGLRESKVQLALEETAAKQAEMEAMRLELDRLERQQAELRGPFLNLFIVFAVLLVVAVLLVLKNIGIHKLDDKLELLGKEKARARQRGKLLRVRTMTRLFSWILTAGIFVAAGYLILETLGFNTTTLLAGAGIAGVALGFGGQYLIRDILNGAFLLIEGQYSVNDVIKVGEYGGVVEDVNLRFTRLRDLEGRVIFIPNGEVKTVVNYTKEYAQALLTIFVAYKENIDRVMEVITQLAKEMREDEYWGWRTQGDLEMLGVDDFGDSGVKILCRIKTLPTAKWEVGREFRRRIKNRFDELGIEIPFPHRMIYWKSTPESDWVERASRQKDSGLHVDKGPVQAGNVGVHPGSQMPDP